jgi:hypothetical protein
MQSYLAHVLLRIGIGKHAFYSCAKWICIKRTHGVAINKNGKRISPFNDASVCTVDLHQRGNQLFPLAIKAKGNWGGMV